MTDILMIFQITHMMNRREDGYPEDLRCGLCRGAYGLSNDILDLGPDRTRPGPDFGGFKNQENLSHLRFSGYPASRRFIIWVI